MGTSHFLSRRDLLGGGLAVAGGLAFGGALGRVATEVVEGPALESIAWICRACGTQFPPTGTAPGQCPICLDERQYVPSDGQAWCRMDDLRKSHRNEWTREEPGLWSLRTRPDFAIAQRALLVETPEGNVLWDCLSLFDEPTFQAIQAKGGLAAIAISHPHFYGAMAAWAQAFKVPVHLHEADRAWVMRPGPLLRFWSGTRMALPGGLMLVHTGGHFEGSQVLHWPAGAGGKGVLLAGDQPNLCADRRWVTFMRSFPNYIPLAQAETHRVMAPLRQLPFDRLYGWTPDRVLRTGAKAALERSAERHLRALRGEHGVVDPSRA